MNTAGQSQVEVSMTWNVVMPASYETDESDIWDIQTFLILERYLLRLQRVGKVSNDNLLNIDRNEQERGYGMKELTEGSQSGTIITFHDNHVQSPSRFLFLFCFKIQTTKKN